MRAVSTEIRRRPAPALHPANDRVDVLLTKRDKNADRRARRRRQCRITCRISAFSPSIGAEEKDGQNAVVGKTVTLELKRSRRDAGRARQTGTLSLALRSIADVNMSRTGSTKPKRAKASTWFATASKARRRHRSDRKDARYEMQGISWRCGPSWSAPCRFHRPLRSCSIRS